MSSEIPEFMKKEVYSKVKIHLHHFTNCSHCKLKVREITEGHLRIILPELQIGEK